MAEPELWRAARDNDTAAARRCLVRGDDVDRCYSTPLLLAAEHANPELLLLLLTHRADIQATDIYGDTALHKAAQGRSVKCAQILIAKGADVNAVSSDNR